MFFLPILLFLIIWLPFLYYFRWRWYRLPVAMASRKETNAQMPPVTIIIPLARRVEGIRNLISALSEQRYNGGISILIVNHSGEKVVEDELLNLEKDFRNLRHTTITTTSHLIDKDKLALTIGVKGARTEWCVLIDPNIQAPAPNWLQTMAQGFTDENSKAIERNIVVGYSNYEQQECGLTLAQYDFHLLNLQNLQLASGNKVTSGIITNVAISRTHFLESNGYDSRHYRLTIGAIPLLVEHLSQTGRIIMILNEEAAILKTAENTATQYHESFEHYVAHYYMSLKTKCRLLLHHSSTVLLLTVPFILLYAALQNIGGWYSFFTADTFSTASTSITANTSIAANTSLAANTSTTAGTSFSADTAFAASAYYNELLILPNSPQLWQIISHAILVLAAFIITIHFPLKWMQRGLLEIGCLSNRLKLLFYAFLTPIYRVKQYLHAFLCRNNYIRRL